MKNIILCNWTWQNKTSTCRQ